MRNLRTLNKTHTFICKKKNNPAIQTQDLMFVKTPAIQTKDLMFVKNSSHSHQRFNYVQKESSQLKQE